MNTYPPPRTHSPPTWRALTFALALLAPASGLAEPYWTHPQNQQRARSVAAGERVAIPGIREGQTLRSRVEAVARLSDRLGEPLVLRGPRGDEATLDRVEAFFNLRGDVRTLHARGPEAALVVRVGSESYADAALRFVAENAALWDLQEAELGLEGLASLEVRQVETTETPQGTPVTTVYFEQYWRGLSVLDTDIRAVFWGDRLIKWTGPVLNAATDWIRVEDGFIDVDEAVSLASERLVREGHAVYEAEVEGFGVSVNTDRAIYRVKVIAANFSGEEDVVESFDTWLDAQTGEVVEFRSNHQHFPSTTANYRVYSPNAGSLAPDT